MLATNISVENNSWGAKVLLLMVDVIIINAGIKIGEGTIWSYGVKNDHRSRRKFDEGASRGEIVIAEIAGLARVP